MTTTKSMSPSWVKAACVVTLVGTLIGCGSIKHTRHFEPGFVAPSGARAELRRVENATGQTYDVDVCQMFTDAMTEALRERQLLFEGNPGSGHVAIDAKVVEYAKGNAFKRWLLPGWGTTVLSVHCGVLQRQDGKAVGRVEARRTISIGGGYSIGAWRTIFRSVAKDVAKELAAELRKQG